MDYSKLLDLTVELGYQLTLCGAETFRVEESVNLILKAYGVKGEVFAIPNCMHVSIETDDGTPMTRMRRIGEHGNDLDAVERFTGLSRRICAQTPDMETALAWLHEASYNRRYFTTLAIVAGYMLSSFGFSLLFGGTLWDALCASVCGLLVWIADRIMNHLGANHFFKTIASAFLFALLAYGFGALGLSPNPDYAAIGALMLLVPGLLFTNAMRDILYGDTNSGVNRIVQVLLIAVAIALGTAASWNVAATLWGAPAGGAATNYSLLQQLIPCAIGCIGFAIIFNIHGPGSLLCALGGVLAWVVYTWVTRWTGSDINGFFWAAVIASAYSEIMARIRKYPAISYLVVSIFPLIPGAGVYYTMRFAMQGQMDRFAAQGMHTAAIAGSMAVGILLVSTVFRIIHSWQKRKKQN